MTLVPQPKKMFLQLGGHVDGRAAQRDDGLLAAAALRPIDVALVAECQPFGDTGLKGLDALFLFEEFIALTAVFKFVAEFSE